MASSVNQNEPARIRLTFTATSQPVAISREPRIGMRIDGRDYHISPAVYCGNPYMLLAPITFPLGLVGIAVSPFDVGDIAGRYRVISPGKPFSMETQFPSKLWKLWHSDPVRRRSDAWQPGRHTVEVVVSQGYWIAPAPLFWRLYESELKASTSFEVTEELSSLQPARLGSSLRP